MRIACAKSRFVAAISFPRNCRAAVSPLAVSRCLTAIRVGLGLPLDDALEMEAALFGLCFTSEDMREGTSAFLEKRPAHFTGR